MPKSAMHHGTGAMQAGYSLATSLVSDVLAVQAPGYNAALQQMSGATTPSILVVDGHHDQFHHVLEAADVPYARIGNPANFAAALEEIPGIRTVLINCGNDFPADQVAKVAEFVHAGGMLMTTDWALKHVVQEAFPGTISYEGDRRTGHEFVIVDAWKSNSLPEAGKNALVHMVKAEGGDPKWWLESSSYPITRLSDGVEILLYSKQLKAAHGRGSVMVRFQWGEGWVYHMISHAFLQYRAPGNFAPCSADASAAPSTQLFTQSLSASPATVEAYTSAEEADPEFDAGTAKSTAISQAAVLIPLIQHTAEPVATSPAEIDANVPDRPESVAATPAPPPSSAPFDEDVVVIPVEDIDTSALQALQAATTSRPWIGARAWRAIWGWIRSFGRGNS